MGVNINELPADVSRRLQERPESRDRFSKLPHPSMKVCTESDEPLAVQRKALELALNG